MLRKVTLPHFVPGIVGRPAVAPTPARRVCSSTPARGHYVTTCETVCIPIVTGGNSGDISVGGTVGPRVEYLCGIPVCRSKWVQTAPAGPIVCVDYPATPGSPGVPSVPPRTEYVPSFEWDAGANSIEEFAGSCRVKFTMRKVLGAVIGLTNTRESPAQRERLSHAFYLTQTGGGDPIAQIMESGRVRGVAFPYTPETEFEIRRIGPEVVYLVDGEVVRTSAVPFVGTAVVGAAIYASEDAVG